jgi:hypothetical protein
MSTRYVSGPHQFSAKGARKSVAFVRSKIHFLVTMLMLFRAGVRNSHRAATRWFPCTIPLP